ncbi:MAG: GTPase Era [Actinomycetaceae bacterium]|nr:GTPase Era [Actinomycetaceae bacterium]
MVSFKQDGGSYRAGFASIVGRPNVGKSTLTNALVGRKIAITSDRPETTRHNIRGIMQADQAQVVLVDTPGYHKPRTILGQRLNDQVREALSDIDVVLFCLPADQKIGPGDKFIASHLKNVKTAIIAVLTKIDKVGRDSVLERLTAIQQLDQHPHYCNFEQIIAVSAHENTHVDTLRSLLCDAMPASPPLYPLDAVTDEPDTVMIEEIIRESALSALRQELPHSVAVQVDEMIERPDLIDDTVSPSDSNDACDSDTAKMDELCIEPVKCPVDVHVTIYVERESQKRIVIGKGGAGIRRIRVKSQGRVRTLLGRKAYIKLHVRVLKNWQSNPKLLSRLGFS